MSLAYLDSSVLIAYLYEERDQPERFAQSRRLMTAIQEGSVNAIVSFYALPELYSHVEEEFSGDAIAIAFRSSLLRLLSLPIIIKPFLNRGDLNELRAKFTISDAHDARHVASALSSKCDAIITFDYHFRQVSNLIPVYTPEEYLAKLESTQVG